ncbi:AAA family ATPase [Sorangium sp. So ce1036]|uniref:AAA family ATPase n=1 Tax=Sorangium sp. So ce1036 TaxID=3133328 RepID=UPI003F058B8A
MLTSIRLRNFKSFADETVELSPFTLLLGANGSGKSNLLDALRFLQGIGLDLPLSDVFRGRVDGRREVWPGLRGGAQGAARRGARSFTIESRWAIGKEELTHRITCQVEPDVLVEHESLEAKVAGAPLFDTHTSALKGLEGLASGGVVWPSAKKTRSMRIASVDRNPARRSLLGQIEHHRGRAEEASLADVIALCNALQVAMRSALSLDIDPSRMRGYVPHDADNLGAGGQNLSALLRRLCDEADHKEDVLGWLRAVFTPEIDDIEFAETGLGDVMMVLVEKGGTRVPAPSLPDGALRALGNITGLLTAPEGSLVLVEDPDAGLYPERAGLLAQHLEGAARPAGCQLVAATHSPSLLRGVSKQGLSRAIVFQRDPETAATVTRRLGDLPRFEEITERDPGEFLSAKALTG